ncbi:unnamed protein product [Durusdinium trenchii]|uniref:Uncharacterized protein n=1 Tax=Durusdinium trenchii TaxID=1381693 RepID=A0ABP0LUX5_9DINO
MPLTPDEAAQLRYLMAKASSDQVMPSLPIDAPGIASGAADPDSGFSLIPFSGSMTDASKRREELSAASPQPKKERGYGPSAHPKFKASGSMEGSYAATEGIPPPMPGSDLSSSMLPTLPPDVMDMHQWGRTVIQFGQYKGLNMTYHDLACSPEDRAKSYVKWVTARQRSASGLLLDLSNYLSRFIAERDAAEDAAWEGPKIPGTDDPKVVWTRPLPPDQVLELEELRTRLEGLKKKVEMLASHFQDEQVTISFDASSCRSSNNSGEAEQLSHWPESASAGESHPAQDQTQAASEAVQLAESAAAMQAQAGAGFHPHQPRADTRPGPDRHQEPGLLPWTTVKQGSLILISAWGIGLVWSILRLWTDVVDILDPPKKPDNPDLELLFDGPWPRYFQPRGLACDERDRDEAPRILIAEKHEVHQLLQEEHWTLSTSSMEAACLSTQPRFHASGLRGISLQCAHEGCESVLVGEGSRALRCGGNETAELKLHGGPWHLATSLDQGVWATRPAESSPVLLHPGSDGWVPALQLAEHPAASDQRLLDRLQDGGLLAMSHAGRIHAWQPQASSSSWLPSGWSYDLPDDLGLSWTGLCTAGSSLILLGQAAGKVEVWRLSLPALRGSA